MLWDIDNYIGNKNFNYITYILNVDIFNIGCDCNIYDYNDLNNFKVEKNKEDLAFYDPKNNMCFFNKLYKVIGTPPFLENPFEIEIFSEFLDNYINLKSEMIENLTTYYVDDPLNNT
jgi:hypothetical protein